MKRDGRSLREFSFSRINGYKTKATRTLLQSPTAPALVATRSQNGSGVINAIHDRSAATLPPRGSHWHMDIVRLFVLCFLFIGIAYIQPRDASLRFRYTIKKGTRGVLFFYKIFSALFWEAA